VILWRMHLLKYEVEIFKAELFTIPKKDGFVRNLLFTKAEPE
jgi:hypothetical protein